MLSALTKTWKIDYIFNRNRTTLDILAHSAFETISRLTCFESFVYAPVPWMYANGPETYWLFMQLFLCNSMEASLHKRIADFFL